MKKYFASFSVFVYCRVLVHKQCCQIRWARFVVYSGKSAYRPIGQRGDPLKFLMYRAFIDIAGKSPMAGLCPYWFRSVCISSAITAKSSKIQVLCIAFDHFAVNGPLATQSMISSHFQLPGAGSVAIAVRKMHFHSAASFVQICMYRLMRTSPCVQTRRY